MERQPRNYRQGESGGAGAPRCLRPPYVAMPEDAISQETESSRVSAGRVPPDTVIEVSEEDLDRLARMPADMRRAYEEALWTAYEREVARA